MLSIELFNVKTNQAKYTRNLGVIVDKNFPFCSHISGVCTSCSYLMRDLRYIRQYLDVDSAHLLVTALVSSRLDYCNPLLYDITDSDLTKIQRVQNRLASVVTKSPPFICSVLLFCFFHWLPVKFRYCSRYVLCAFLLYPRHPLAAAGD